MSTNRIVVRDALAGPDRRELVDTTEPDGYLRPTWRGLIHRYAVLTFVPLVVALLAITPRGGDRLAVAVYALGVGAMLGVSAFYHSGRLSPRAAARMKRVDHATILLAIAGSYTAIATLSLEAQAASQLLAFTWVATVVGVAIRMVWLRAPYPVVAMVYVVVGWSALLQWSALAVALTGVQMGLLIGGGLLYTAGAGVYAAHRPNPWPATFGYHEVFHALVVAGVSAHFLVALSLVIQAR